MKKLALELEDLDVETFEVEALDESEGTVIAHVSTGGWWQCQWACVESPQESELCTIICQESIDFACG